MSSEENPPSRSTDSASDFHSVEETAADSGSAVDNPASDTSQIHEAELANPVADGQDNFDTKNALLATPAGLGFSNAPPIASNMENMAANGGAVGALVLGIWVVLGSFITSWSLINGILGLVMGFWGLTSRKQRMAWVGIALCLVGIFMCLVEVNQVVNEYLNAVDETEF